LNEPQIEALPLSTSRTQYNSKRISTTFGRSNESSTHDNSTDATKERPCTFSEDPQSTQRPVKECMDAYQVLLRWSPSQRYCTSRTFTLNAKYNRGCAILHRLCSKDHLLDTTGACPHDCLIVVALQLRLILILGGLFTQTLSLLYSRLELRLRHALKHPNFCEHTAVWSLLSGLYATANAPDLAEPHIWFRDLATIILSSLMVDCEDDVKSLCPSTGTGLNSLQEPINQCAVDLARNRHLI
jgi:hypothetical protein